jgi:hypothetical protein
MEPDESVAREDGIAGYERFLAERDGEPNLSRHTLSRRSSST